MNIKNWIPVLPGSFKMIRKPLTIFAQMWKDMDQMYMSKQPSTRAKEGMVEQNIQEPLIPENVLRAANRAIPYVSYGIFRHYFVFFHKNRFEA